MMRHGLALSVVTAIAFLIGGLSESPAEAAQAKAPAKKPRWYAELEPVHIAAFEGDVTALKKALDGGADINVKAKYRAFAGYTPLHLAAFEGHTKAVLLLVQKKANINAPATDKKTPLHLAAAYGRLEAVRELIKAGAEVNAKDKIGNTPLRAASDKAVIAELKKAGGME